MGPFHVYKLGLAITCLILLSNAVNGLEKDDVNRSPRKLKRQSAGNNLVFYQANGAPGVDYPVLSYIPRTTFSCKNVDGGYYADLETDCQVFHICDEGRKMSFLCPNGTIFEQSELICEWWFKVNCSKAPSLYQESAEQLQRENAKRKASRKVATEWGTKQGVFPDSSELYNSGNNDGNHRTPARFVTPSYIYSTTTPRSYKVQNQNDNERGGRKFKFSDSGNSITAQASYNTFSTKSYSSVATTSSPQYKNTITPRVTFNVKSSTIQNPPLNNFQTESPKSPVQNRPFSYVGNSNFPNNVNNQKNLAPTFAPFDFSSFPTKSSINRNDIRMPAGFSHNENSRNNARNNVASFSITAKPVENKGQIVSSEESQEPQESASFVKSSFNNFQSLRQPSTAYPYTNHKQTYSELKDPRYYYPKPQHQLPDKPFVGSTVDSAILTTIPVSTSKDAVLTELNPTTEFIPKNSISSQGDKEKSTILDKPNLNVEVFQRGETPSTTKIPIIGTGQFSSIRVISTPTPQGKSLPIASTISTPNSINPDLRFNDYGSSTPRAPFKIHVLKPDNSISDDILNKKFEPSEERQGKSLSGASAKNKITADKNSQVLLDVSNKNEFKGRVKLKNKQYNDRFSTDNFNYKPTKVIPAHPPRGKSQEETSTRRNNQYLPTDSTTARPGNRYLPTGPSKIGEGPRKESEFQPIEPPILDSESISRFKDNKLLPVGPFEETVSPIQTTTKEEEHKLTTLPATTTISSRINTEITTQAPEVTTFRGTTTVGGTETTFNLDVRYEDKSTQFDSTTPKPFTATTSITNQPTTLITEDQKVATESTPSTIGDEDLLLQTSSIMQPKPFSLPTTEASNNLNEETSTGTTSLPESSRDGKFLFVNPTQPTPFTTENAQDTTDVDNESITNMILTLMELAKKRLESIGGEFSTSRPGLVVPPSAGPETLHTLARYFADALESVTVKPDEGSDAESEAKQFGNDALIRALLSQMTIDKYEDLFKDSTETETTEATIATKSGIQDETDNDLERQSSMNPTQGPSVRQLARVFTEALASYLEDPVTFKKVLHQVRPTDPPELARDESTTTGDDELLNFSDQDLKPDQPRLPTVPTGSPLVPTWGYIVALNKSDDSDNVENRNSLSSQKENLQGADSQSFVSQFNRLSPNGKSKIGATTEQSSTTESSKKDTTVPDDHWTKSPDLTKFLQSTLALSPSSFNENFDSLGGVTSAETDFTSNQSTESDSEEETASTPNLPDVTEVKYELRALPKVELNSSQVHGILLDFMSANNTEGAEKMQRVLHKLNITQDEFVNKMKEIEGNPVTRRLILLLISECNNGNNNELETKAASVDGLIGLIRPQAESLHTASSSNFGPQELDGKEITSRHLKDAINPSVAHSDEDKRALQLLNSLYVIASKFGK